MPEEDAMGVHILYIRQALSRIEGELQDAKRELAEVQRKIPYDLEPRVRDLESWKAKVIGVATAAGAVAGLVVKPLLDWFRGGK